MKVEFRMPITIKYFWMEGFSHVRELKVPKLPINENARFILVLKPDVSYNHVKHFINALDARGIEYEIDFYSFQNLGKNILFILD